MITTILVSIAYGILCFLLGYSLACLRILDRIKLYEKAEKLHNEIHEIDNKLIEKGKHND